MQAVWTDYLGNSYGPAGGTGGEPFTNIDIFPRTYTPKTNYGGGGTYVSGGGGQGLIIITYTPVVTIGNSYTEVLNESGSTAISTPSRWRIPYGVNSVNVHAIGSGSSGATASPWGGGGGGAYANSTIDVSTLNNTGAYYLNYFTSGLQGGSDAWFNKVINAAPTSIANGALAKASAAGSRTGGLAASSVGTIRYSGGTGGQGAGTTIRKVGGAGGAAGPSGDGKNGGDANAGSSASSGGGGGSNGGSSTAGATAPNATTAGAGGAGNGGTGGGAAATATTNAGNGSNGGGGGGGKNTNGTFLNGGAGGTQNIWTDSGTANSYGPGGGGGGSAATNSTNIGTPGAAGQWGGGTGYFNVAGHPLIVLQYTIVKAAPVDAIVTSGNMFMMFN
jgi:hypothetical protein